MTHSKGGGTSVQDGLIPKAEVYYVDNLYKFCIYVYIYAVVCIYVYI